ncbi:MAG: hypothetical protein M1817_000920 [Caeruleum heppii]|nr:MAG: hypothetical protein M1817_000920 [Caeruleum heppii]
MKSGVLFFAASSLLTAATVNARIAGGGNYSSGAPFVLRSKVQQENGTEFGRRYVSVTGMNSTNGTGGSMQMVLGKMTEATAFRIMNGSVVVDNSSPPVSISLYPAGTNVQISDNGTSVARGPDGIELTPDGPGEYRTPILDTTPGTPNADATRQYGLLFNDIRFLMWGACDSSSSGTNQSTVSWLRAPGPNVGPPGCTNMFLIPERPLPGNLRTQTDRSRRLGGGGSKTNDTRMAGMIKDAIAKERLGEILSPPRGPGNGTRVVEETAKLAAEEEMRATEFKG